MRKMMIAGAMCLMAGAVAAECREGRSDVIALTSWSVDKEEVSHFVLGDQTFITTTMDIESRADRPFRMIEGAVWFRDALDRHIVGFGLDPDLTLAPGEGAEYVRSSMGTQTEAARLYAAAHDDVRAFACVKGIVYDDGAVERFD